MSIQEEKKTEQQLTLMGIASYRRTLYLTASSYLTPILCLAALMEKEHVYLPGARSILMIMILAVLWLLVKLMDGRKRSEPTNLMLISTALYALALTVDRVGDGLLLMAMAMGLGLYQLGRVVRVIQQVIGYALPKASRRAMLSILGCMAGSIALGYILYILCWSTALPMTFLSAIATMILLLSVLALPVDNRYAHKLKRYLHQCPENEQLRKRLDWAFVQPHRRPWLLLFLEFVLRPLYHYRLKDTENIHEDEDNPLIYLCNHGISFGPVACVLHIPSMVRPWSISYIMVDRDEAAEYMHRYSFGESNKLIPKPLKWPVSRLVARFSIWALNHLLECVPVFRDKPRQLMNTFRISADALTSGDQLLIFPENPNAVCQDHGYEPEGLGELFSGFAMIAPIYYNRTGKCARFMPMYAHPKARTMSFGHEIVYQPDTDPTTERNRIAAEAEAEMRRLMEREDALFHNDVHTH